VLANPPKEDFTNTAFPNFIRKTGEFSFLIGGLQTPLMGLSPGDPNSLADNLILLF